MRVSWLYSVSDVLVKGKDNPLISSRGMCRDSDGSWSLKYFHYNDYEESEDPPSPDYVLPSIDELRRRENRYKEGSSEDREPPAHFNVKASMECIKERRRARMQRGPPSHEGFPPPLNRSLEGTWRHVDGRWHPKNL